MIDKIWSQERPKATVKKEPENKSIYKKVKTTDEEFDASKEGVLEVEELLSKK